ncbi:MAG: ADP-ribosylglycohydrolase family protein [Bacteroidales bacterium]|nr:ADP-ribosylglycohydrolase family protein [Bacteroidales bacterium]
MERQVNDTLKDRIVGCMVGGAVGDALGYAVEFDSRRDILRKYGE